MTDATTAKLKSMRDLLEEAANTLDMWADVAPAVSLRADIRRALALDGQEGEVEKRLRDRLGEDHARGCEGRHYTCSCGFDSETDALVTKAADAIAQLRAERDEARQSAKVRLHSIQTHADKHSEACAALTAAESELTKLKSELEATAARELELRQIVRVDYEGAKAELTKVRTVAQKILDKLDHPTASVTQWDADELRQALAHLTPETAQT